MNQPITGVYLKTTLVGLPPPFCSIHLLLTSVTPLSFSNRRQKMALFNNVSKEEVQEAYDAVRNDSNEINW